ncbi:MAG: hypothetical protein JXP34_00640 [Planctomycetes bacterium]|nr:hypothetical protein [Planctomycetota bacterium]
MFDWRRQWRIRQAGNALRDGRLDEAYEIVTEAELRDYRQAQGILEGLVDPLLDRAAVHLAKGNLEDALADVGRAVEAGGSRPRAVDLRREIEAAIGARENDRRRARDRLESARGHLDRGEIEAGRAVLDGAFSAPGVSVERVRHALEARERDARDLAARAETALGRGEIATAIDNAARAIAVAPRDPEIEDLVSRTGRVALEAIDGALRDGDLRHAEAILGRIERLRFDPPAVARRAQALSLCRRAAGGIVAGDFEEARVAIERLSGLLADADWVRATSDALRATADALLRLRSGPLGCLESDAARGADPKPAVNPHAATAPPPSIAGNGARPASGSAPGPMETIPDRLLLWVDGTGAFLLLRSNRIAVGRSGSSARPHIALAGDLEGVHAEILRVEEDYFLTARGPVQVNGKRTDEKLLADGDRISLDGKTSLTFRLPSKLSATAVVKIGGGQRLEGHIRDVVLLDRAIVFGPNGDAHIPVRGGSRAVLTVGRDGLRLRSPEGIEIDGRKAGTSTAIPIGARVRAGELSFAVTGLGGGR